MFELVVNNMPPILSKQNADEFSFDTTINSSYRYSSFNVAGGTNTTTKKTVSRRGFIIFPRVCPSIPALTQKPECRAVNSEAIGANPISRITLRMATVRRMGVATPYHYHQKRPAVLAEWQTHAVIDRKTHMLRHNNGSNPLDCITIRETRCVWPPNHNNEVN